MGELTNSLGPVHSALYSIFVRRTVRRPSRKKNKEKNATLCCVSSLSSIYIKYLYIYIHIYSTMADHKKCT
jgi:hypothetical protein